MVNKLSRIFLDLVISRYILKQFNSFGVVVLYETITLSNTPCTEKELPGPSVFCNVHFIPLQLSTLRLSLFIQSAVEINPTISVLIVDEPQSQTHLFGPAQPLALVY